MPSSAVLFLTGERTPTWVTLNKTGGAKKLLMKAWENDVDKSGLPDGVPTESEFGMPSPKSTLGVVPGITLAYFVHCGIPTQLGLAPNPRASKDSGLDLHGPVLAFCEDEKTGKLVDLPWALVAFGDDGKAVTKEGTKHPRERSPSPQPKKKARTEKSTCKVDKCAETEFKYGLCQKHHDGPRCELRGCYVVGKENVFREGAGHQWRCKKHDTFESRREHPSQCEECDKEAIYMTYDGHLRCNDHKLREAKVKERKSKAKNPEPEPEPESESDEEHPGKIFEEDFDKVVPYLSKFCNWYNSKDDPDMHDMFLEYTGKHLTVDCKVCKVVTPMHMASKQREDQGWCKHCLPLYPNPDMTDDDNWCISLKLQRSSLPKGDDTLLWAANWTLAALGLKVAYSEVVPCEESSPWVYVACSVVTEGHDLKKDAIDRKIATNTKVADEKFPPPFQDTWRPELYRVDAHDTNAPLAEDGYVHPIYINSLERIVILTMQ